MVLEQKNGKFRVCTVPLVIAQYIDNCRLRNGIQRNDLIFPITARAVKKQLHIVCDYLVFEQISTHSFRKWYSTEINKAMGMILRWCKSFCSIAAQRSHSGILVLNHRGLRKQ